MEIEKMEMEYLIIIFFVLIFVFLLLLACRDRAITKSGFLKSINANECKYLVIYHYAFVHHEKWSYKKSMCNDLDILYRKLDLYKLNYINSHMEGMDFTVIDMAKPFNYVVVYSSFFGSDVSTFCEYITGTKTDAELFVLDEKKRSKNLFPMDRFAYTIIKKEVV